MMSPRRLLGLCALPGTAVILLSTSGCATAWARGVVRDGAGDPVSGAEVLVSAAGAKDVSARGKSEWNGCFNVVASVRKGETEFVLAVVAPGYKPVSIRFPRKDRLTGLVTLVGEGSPEEGSVTRVAEVDQPVLYEQPCIPPVPAEASAFGLR